MGCSPTPGMGLKGGFPLLAPVTVTCLSMWRFVLPLSITSTFWLNRVLSSFKLVCHGKWLLVVGWSTGGDEVRQVEWDSWVLHDEVDLAALVGRSRIYHVL